MISDSLSQSETEGGGSGLGTKLTKLRHRRAGDGHLQSKATLPSGVTEVTRRADASIGTRVAWMSSMPRLCLLSLVG